MSNIFSLYKVPTFAQSDEEPHCGGGAGIVHAEDDSHTLSHVLSTWLTEYIPVCSLKTPLQSFFGFLQPLPYNYYFLLLNNGFGRGGKKEQKKRKTIICLAESMHWALASKPE